MHTTHTYSFNRHFAYKSGFRPIDVDPAGIVEGTNRQILQEAWFAATGWVQQGRDLGRSIALR